MVTGTDAFSGGRPPVRNRRLARQKPGSKPDLGGTALGSPAGDLDLAAKPTTADENGNGCQPRQRTTADGENGCRALRLLCLADAAFAIRIEQGAPGHNTAYCRYKRLNFGPYQARGKPAARDRFRGCGIDNNTATQ